MPSSTPFPCFSLAAFGRSRRGVAAVEFAFLAPFLIVCLLGGFELSKYINTIRRVGYVANSIAEEIAQNTSSTITPNDLYFYNNSAMLIFPGVTADAARKGVYWWNDISITMSGISFSGLPAGCTSTCTSYAPTVAWSGNAGWNPVTWRSCVVAPVQASNTAPPSLATLPADAYGPGFLVVVDVVYTYTPFVATKLFSPMTIRRSFYIQPRYVSVIKLTGTDPIGVACPGWAGP